MSHENQSLPDNFVKDNLAQPAGNLSDNNAKYDTAQVYDAKYGDQTYPDAKATDLPVSQDGLQAVTTPDSPTVQLPVAVIPAKFFTKSRMLNFNGILIILFSLQFFLQQFTDLKIITLLFPHTQNATYIGNVLSAVLLIIGDLIAVINVVLRLDTNQPITFSPYRNGKTNSSGSSTR